MTLRLILATAAATCLLAACGRAPSIEGTWRNGDGNLVTFRADSVALLGQEGYAGADSGRWTIDRDTVRVRTNTQVDELGPVRNDYVFTTVGDTLHLYSVSLYRSGTVRTTFGDELARRLGKPRSQLAFTRVPAPTEGE